MNKQEISWIWRILGEEVRTLFRSTKEQQDSGAHASSSALFKRMTRLRTVRQLLGFSGTVIGLALLLVVVGAVFKLNTHSAAANDCSTNAIIKCGFNTASQFISTVQSGNGGTQKDLAAIYANYGLASADYSRFVSSARPGTAFKDGTIVVDGQTVATNAQSIGRVQKANSHAKVIPGAGTYWEDTAQNVFNSNSIPVMVLFNAQGKMQFAVMQDCGNPTSGTPTVPTYACNDLQRRQIDRTTYGFSTSASAGNGASINHVVYDFGDGTTVTKTNPAEEVSHSYAKDGTFNAKVTVYVNVPGAQTVVIAAAGNCVKQVVVAPPAPKPVAACTSLTVLPLDRTKFRLNAVASAASGATISRYAFTVKNANGVVVTAPAITTTAPSASADVNLPTPGSYSAQVTVATSLGNESGPQCTKPITVAPAPVADCKQLTVTPLDRTTYKLSGSATAANGATVQGYDYTVKDTAGKTVATQSLNTTNLSSVANVTIANAGTYTASLSVRTSLGPKTESSCAAALTVPQKPIPPVPSVSIVKTVDGQKSEQVAVGQTFTYQLVVTNDGKVDLQHVVVTDSPQAGITLLSASLGTISGNNWTDTIPSLAIGAHASFTITATVAAYVPGSLVNTACVNAPEVNPTHPNDTDACDTASVTVPPPSTPPTPPSMPPTTTVLPDTGAGNTVGIFAATVLLSGLGYRMFLSRNLSRKL